MSDATSTILATNNGRNIGSNKIPNNEFRGTVGGSWKVVATVDPSLLSTPQEPIISQEDEDEMIQICFNNFSGILTMTKGISGEMLLSLDADHSVPSKEWWPANMAPEQRLSNSISDFRSVSPTTVAPKVVRLNLSPRSRPKLPSPTRVSPKSALPSPSILKRKEIESSPRQDKYKVGEEQKPEQDLAAAGTQNSMKARPAAPEFVRSVSWKAPTNLAIIPETETTTTTTTIQHEQKPHSPPPPPPPPLLDPGDMADDIDNSAHLEQPVGSLYNKPSTLKSTTTKSIAELYEYNTGPKSERVPTGSDESTWEPSIELTQSSRDDSGYDEYDTIDSLSGRPPPPPPFPFSPGGSPGRTAHPRKHWNDYSFRPQDLAKDVKSTENRRKSGMSLSAYGDWDPNESDYASPLHEACDSPFATMGELEDALTDCPKAVSKIDDQGRLPLHILANNRELIVAGGDAGREMATSFAKQLIRAYPESVLIVDNDGRLPFTGQIVRWIEWTYSKQDDKEKPGIPVTQTSVSGRTFASRLIPYAFRSNHTRSGSSRGVAVTSLARGLSSNSEIESINPPNLNRGVSAPVEGSTKRFPPAEMTEEVEWCFDMLSLALDLSGGRTASGISRPQLSYKSQLMNRETIARNVGSIPLLLKTILLLEANDERARIFKSSIIRRVLLSPESVGSWLTSMLRYRPIPSRLAVDYFEIISNLSVQDFIGHFRKPSPGDMLEFRAAREIMFEEIFDLGGTIPSLVVLDEKEIERAASTRAVYFVMSKSLRQPLVVALVVTDFVMQITLMLAFRSAVVTPDISILTTELPIPANSVIITICAYLLFREHVDIVALAGVSKKVLYRHLYDPWYE
jgi:hypothetical protein